MALEVASRWEVAWVLAGRWAFLLGYWCAVFSSMLAIWQGVPNMFADLVSHSLKSPVANLE